MKAMALTGHGGPEVMEFEEFPTPSPGPGEVRIQVKAAALNHLDLWVRRGHPGLQVELPHIPCSDVSGVVDSIGSGVTRCSPGDDVLLYPALYCNKCEACLTGRQNHCNQYHILGENTSGGLAEYLVVPERNVYHCPEGLSHEEAAAFPLAWLTSWHMLRQKVQIHPGDWVLIQAGASGTGLAALQIALLHGARVIVTAGTDEKCSRLLKMGASAAVNYRNMELRPVVKALTKGAGCAVVMDHVGESTFRQSMSCLARGGSFVTCGGTSGAHLLFDVRHLFIKHQRIIGSTMGDVGDFQQLLQLMKPVQGSKPGDLWPVIHKVYSWADAAQAHRDLELRQAFGKVVLRVDGSFATT